MPSLAQQDTPLSTRLAEDLLRAWRSGNVVAVQAQLQRTLAVSTEAMDVGEEERRHLVQAVAARLCSHPDVSKIDDPVLEVCAKLLGHLVSAE